MSLDLDDAQRWRHGAQQMVEMAQILDNALLNAEFPMHIRDEMVLSWWRTMLAQSTTVNLEQVFERMFPIQEDDE